MLTQLKYKKTAIIPGLYQYKHCEPVYGFKPYKYKNIYAPCTGFFFVYC
jgi:hypothetical protein